MDRIPEWKVFLLAEVQHRDGDEHEADEQHRCAQHRVSHRGVPVGQAIQIRVA